MRTLPFVCCALWGYINGLSVQHFMRASSPDVKTLLVKAGDKVELDCSAVGHPNTEIFWYKYNIPLLDITYRKLEDTLESRKLVLDNVLLADSGNYSCHMNSTLGSISRTFILHVCESSNNQPMILKALLANTTATLGSEASFHCHVTSDSVTYFRWYFKRVVNVSSNSTRKELNEITNVLPSKVSSFADNGLNSHLFRGEVVFVIQNNSFKDEGEYICEAFNEHGKVRHGAFLMVVKGPTHSAHEIEARYAARFGKTLQLPLAMLIAVPVAFMILMTAVFIRALERAKQKYGVGLVKKTDMKGGELVMKERCQGNKESANQKMKKEIVICDPRCTPNYIKSNGAQHTMLLAKQVTCEAATCSCDRLPSPRDSDVSSKRCSGALELEWEGIELVMEDGCEILKLSKEEEV